ncbi:MAG: hypothetical protein HQM08_25145 [Candidatus Riflebacteria bacterium]|nr:hypothetical protein [Candidatus Riflebacteria bacterium]
MNSEKTSWETPWLCILEDNDNRAQAMARLITETWGAGVLKISPSSQEIISWLEKHYETTRVISLDHDLGEPLPGVPCQDGMQVVTFLERQKPIVPVIIHSVNTVAASTMASRLEKVGFIVRKIFPEFTEFGSKNLWLKSVLELIDIVDFVYFREEKRTELMVELLKAIKANLSELKKLLSRNNGEWGYEDPIYRFYHQSFKVYHLQQGTIEIVQSLNKLLPTLKLNSWFFKIFLEGTGKVFKMEDNQNWLVVTRPILEAFFHARYFLEMAVKYGEELESPPNCMPSGLAALLYLYNL